MAGTHRTSAEVSYSSLRRYQLRWSDIHAFRQHPRAVASRKVIESRQGLGSSAYPPNPPRAPPPGVVRCIRGDGQPDRCFA